MFSLYLQMKYLLYIIQNPLFLYVLLNLATNSRAVINKTDFVIDLVYKRKINLETRLAVL